MNKKYEISYLSQEFFKKYNPVDYPEIENKSNRPYMVLLVKIDSNTFAIPFRTNVKHKSCYKFKNTSRNTNSSTGLDYSKAVIINDKKYFGSPAFIDNKEYIELNNKYHFIIKQFTAYVNGYKKYLSGQSNEFEARKYKFSTLQYFHDEMGLNKEQPVADTSAPVKKALFSRAKLNATAQSIKQQSKSAPEKDKIHKKDDPSL